MQNARLVVSRLRNWVADWSSGSEADYFSHYSENFIPSDGDYSNWKFEREVALQNTDNISINLSAISVNLLQTSASVTFNQEYRSSNYSDEISKRIIFKLENGNWLIVSEAEI